MPGITPIQRLASTGVTAAPVGRQTRLRPDTRTGGGAAAAGPAVRLGTAGGQPIAPAVRSALEASLRVPLSGVRVHNDGRSAATARSLGARAFTYGPNIFLGPGESSSDIALMAHEAAHVVQQGAGGIPAMQRSAPGQHDSYEREAQQASSAVASRQSFSVQERTSHPRVQRLGLSSVLNYFADKANIIPGFRMFTVILGLNPINMAPVERSAANIMRAVVEFIPGGSLITQALDNYGVFDKVGKWVEGQIHTLGMVGSAFKQALDKFLDSLSLSDIFSPGEVWQRAKRIFTEPIDRLINFAKGLVTDILNFIKDAILMPLAKLAEGTKGWDLLIAVLGKNPITGEPVARNAETLIGGFMKLIGQEEVWENIKKANALARAWAWFQGAVDGLLGFVRQIPGLFVQTLKSLELADIVLLPRAFIKVGTVFGSFLGQFLTWAGNAVWNLLQIIFEVVAPSVMPYLKKVGAAFKSILKNPIGFVGTLVKAGKQGFQQFADNIGTHLKTSLIEWLTGSLPSVYIPKSFDFKEIVKFVLSVLGLTWQNIRTKLVKVVGETAVKAMETGFDVVVTLVTDGPAAAWDKIKEQLSNLKDTVIQGIMDFVIESVVKKAVVKLIGFLIPGAAFIQAIITIYDTVMVFIDKLKKIIQVAKAFLDSLIDIANGVIVAAANKVEKTLAGLLTLAISFLAGFVGLGKVADKVMDIINKKVRQPIDKALDKVIDWIVKTAKKLFAKVFGKDKKDERTEEQKKADLHKGVSEADQLLKDPKLKPSEVEKKLGSIKKKYKMTRLELASKKKSDTEEVDHIEGEINPSESGPDVTKKVGAGDSKDNPIDISWFKPPMKAYPAIQLAPPKAVANAKIAKGMDKDKGDLTPSDVASLPGAFQASPTGQASLDGMTIGVTHSMSQTEPGFTFQAKSKVTGNNNKNNMNDRLKKWGYNRKDNVKPPTDGDHVMEKQLGGPDLVDNVWPLNSGVNQNSGTQIRKEADRAKKENNITDLNGKWIRLKTFTS